MVLGLALPMKLSPFVLTAGIVALGTLPAVADPILVNGAFSDGFTGWSASGDVVAVNGVISGDESSGAVFNAGDTQPNGVLAQTITTTIGDLYQLQFEYNTAQGDWYLPLQYLDISALSPNELLGDVVSGPASEFLTAGSVFDLTFTAGATSTIITFTDDANNFTYSQDGALSNVSVTDLTPASVPDNGSTLLLLGLSVAALAAAACSERFKRFVC